MNPVEKITDIVTAVVVLFIGPVIIFMSLFYSAGLSACERAAHTFVDEIETKHCIQDGNYKAFLRKMSELPRNTGVNICCEEYGFDKPFEINDPERKKREGVIELTDTVPMSVIEKKLREDGKYTVPEFGCILIEINYGGAVLIYRAYDGRGGVK